jgi:hypothetical protein
MEADDVRVHQQPVVQDFAVHVDVDLQLSKISSLGGLVTGIYGKNPNSRHC